MIYITSHISGIRQTWCIGPLEEHITYHDVIDFLYSKEGCKEDICLWNGRKAISSCHENFHKDTMLVATLRLRGGKGGFGSMLRAIGAQIEKTTNREACRDLSGRRLRDINEEKRLKEFLSKKVEKEKETLELKRKKLEQLNEGPKHYFEDKAYFEQREKRENDIHESLDKAFSSKSDDKPTASLAAKRKSRCPTEIKSKRKRLLDDLDDSSESESSENGEAKEVPQGNLKLDMSFPCADTILEPLLESESIQP